jgi:hypothetical protein
MAPPSTRQFSAWFALFAAVWINVAAVGPLAALRFTVPILNVLVFLLAQVIPFRLLAIAGRWSGRRRQYAMVIVVPLLLIALPSACGASACIVLGGASFADDASFERRREVPVSTGKVVVYRTNGGATTNFGIVVRQECVVIPHVLFIAHNLIGQYPAWDAHVTPTDGRSVVVATDADDPMRTEVPFRRWFCLAG